MRLIAFYCDFLRYCWIFTLSWGILLHFSSYPGVEAYCALFYLIASYCTLSHLVADRFASLRDFAPSQPAAGPRRHPAPPQGQAGLAGIDWLFPAAGGRLPTVPVAARSSCGHRRGRRSAVRPGPSAGFPACPSRRLCFWCVYLSPAVFLVCISLAGCVSGVCISRRLCFRNGVSLSPVFFSVCLPRRFSFRCVSLAGFLFGVSLSPVFFSVSPSPAVFPACLSRTLRSSGPARAFDGRGDRHTLSPARTKQGAARPSGAGCTGVSGRAGRPTSRSRPRSREIAARSRRDHVLAAGHRRPSCLATRRGARRTRTGAQMTRRGAQMSRRGAQMTRREGEAAISAPTRPKTLLPGLHRALDACAPFRPLARPPPLLRSLHVSPQLLLY